jgi:urease accessory protein
MTTMLIATKVETSISDIPDGRCTLDYDARFLRRKRLVTDSGTAFLVDLEQTTSLNHGDALVLQNGNRIGVWAAEEPLFAITGENLVQLAWHVGNRHTPCQIELTRLLIQRDKVIGHMLEHLGAVVTEVVEPFTPEGGAYGHGRTHSHEHGHTAHDH